MTGRDIEILPLRDTPEEYTWASPETAEYFTVYERDEEGLAHAQIDLDTLDEALGYALVRQPRRATLWTGDMFVEVRTPSYDDLLLKEARRGPRIP
ncbi:hypothetical protein [Nocardioides sp. AE5]|uniref:hypothetical protein n=1 Tax=Nocardioides sp. AE5 TaxID=2962573 RepID=UPI00288267EA|nr:hypothetical protein [Nocardioides sp. AE5]MDT0203830.1 hypothetical protein [Nocardioides sp. AE5]